MPSYSAVRTTGIYCHPGCSARPLPEHVSHYRSAAAAEADGYRACHRCRPYRIHEDHDWIDGPELVCRAVRLILDGALDGESEVALAERLGVSGRHLRRLFVEHVGATPGGVARSRRCHFARRLLDDSDLSITDVAFASGFGSVRQMTRAMTTTFGSPPTDLRARRRRSDRLVADGGLDCRLPFTPPLDWNRMLDFLSVRAVPGVEAVADGVYRRTIDIEGHAGLLEVRRGGDDHLVARFHLPRWEGLIHLVANVRQMFDLDLDPAAPAAHLGDDALLSPWLAGLRVPGCWDPFEAGVRAILGQQVSVASATTSAGRIATSHGIPVPGLAELSLTTLFPTATELVEAELPVPAARARTIRSFAGAVLDGRLALDASSSLDELVASLVALPGVGPWTAHYLALRLGHRDAFPASDLHVARAVGRAERAEAWSPWRAHATLRLWEA